MAADADVVVVLVDRLVGNVVWVALAGGTSLDRPPPAEETPPLLKDPRPNPVEAGAAVVVTAATEVVAVTEDKFGAPKFKVRADDDVGAGAVVEVGAVKLEE